jgi:hypothetical protein
LFSLDSVEQTVVEEEHLYDSFSPCGSPHPSPRPDGPVDSEREGIDKILAPVLQITPELLEMCEESCVVLPVEQGSIEALAMSTAPLPPQSLVFVDSGGVLAHSSETLFAKELCGLLACLEEVSPGYAGQASEDTIRKVEKSLKKVSIWGKIRSQGVARKALRCA